MNNKMAKSTYLSTIESKNKINKPAVQKQTYRYRKHFASCQMGFCCKVGEKGGGTKKHKLVVTEWSRGCKAQHKRQLIIF